VYSRRAQGVDVAERHREEDVIEVRGRLAVRVAAQATRVVGGNSGDLEESVPRDDLVNRFAVTAAASLLLEVCRPRLVRPRRLMAAQAWLLEVHCPCAHVEWSVQRDGRNVIRQDCDRQPASRHDTSGTVPRSRSGS